MFVNVINYLKTRFYMNTQQRNRIDHSISIIVSILVNGGLFAAMLIYITFDTEPDGTLQQTMVIDPVDQEIIEETEEEIVEEVTDLQEMQDFADFQDVEMEMNMDFEPEPERVDAPANTDMNQLTELLSDIASPVQMTSLLSGRTQLMRTTMVGRFGGRRGAAGQASVDKALKWLKDHQLNNGSWTSSGEPGVSSCAGHTGLALLAFLSHGETPASAEYGQTVTAAMRWIVENQTPNGMIQSPGQVTYRHAMATYALAEAYSVTQNILLREPLIRAVDAIVNGMQRTGGFDYNYRTDSDRNDSSVGGWQVQALKAATIAFPENDRYQQALQLAMDGMLLNSQARDGARTIGYTSPGRNMNVTAAGALGMVFSGRARDTKTRELIASVQTVTPNWETISRGGVYQWYYVGQALFQYSADGRAFRSFNDAMTRELIANQNPDGSWDETGDGGGVRGRAGTTALGALNLMVYYRHLPTGMIQDQPATPTTPGQPGMQDDDLIRITL